MSYVLYIIGAIALVIVCLFGYAATQPGDFKIQRSLVVSAPPEKVFPYINNPRLFEQWNPFSKEDPNVEMAYTGPEAGVGAQSAWVGNRNVGEGSMEIRESALNKMVRVDLHFKKPMAAEHVGQYNLDQEVNGTKVTWTMTGTQPLVARVFCIFMDVDKMVGGQFEKGLKTLQGIVQ